MEPTILEISPKLWQLPPKISYKEHIIHCFLLFILLFLSNSTFASEDTSSLQDDIADKEDNKFITFNIENDLFGSGSDENYTSGVRFSYFNTETIPNDFSLWLSKRLPIFSINETTHTHFSLGQNLYTPSDIRVAQQLPNERPWAAFLYGSLGLTTTTQNHIDDLEATIGVVGPMALGRPIQKFIHRTIDSPVPRGWDNQLKNELGLMLSLQRRWPRMWNTSGLGLTLSAMPHVGATVGNIYTYGNFGATFTIAPKNAPFQDPPLRVRPAMPGTGFFNANKEKLGWYLFAGIDNRLVQHNIFLDGNTFVNSHSVAKRTFVADINTGIAVTYGKTRLSYTLNYRTREFKGQHDPSIFGAISIGRKF
jgi:hypothetical protein